MNLTLEEIKANMRKMAEGAHKANEAKDYATLNSYNNHWHYFALLHDIAENLAGAEERMDAFRRRNALSFT